MGVADESKTSLKTVFQKHNGVSLMWEENPNDAMLRRLPYNQNLSVINTKDPRFLVRLWDATVHSKLRRSR